MFEKWKNKRYLAGLDKEEEEKGYSVEDIRNYGIDRLYDALPMRIVEDDEGGHEVLPPLKERIAHLARGLEGP